MNDTTRRFLTAITERVPAGGRIVELRLFPAIRQGGIESGVAVVAVEPPAIDSEPATGALEEAGAEEPTAVEGAWGGGAPQMESTSDADAPRAANGERVVTREPEGLADDASAAAAMALVDTDISPEEEEGTSGEAAEGATTYIPSAGTSDDDDVADALDDEMTTIVVDTDREIRRTESRHGASLRGVEGPADQPSAAEVVESLAAASADAPTAEQESAPEETSAAVTADKAASPTGAHEGASVGDAASTGELPADAPAPDAGERDDDSPYADAPPPPDALRRELLADVSPGPDADPDAMRLDDILALPSPDNSDDAGEIAAVEESAPSPRAIQRYAILTASYRLTIKGPDRGKWDVDLTHEADAPLATVERVARGVAKRSGDGSDPEHFSGESLKQALDAPAWIETT